MHPSLLVHSQSVIKICYLYKYLSQNRIYSSHTSTLYSIYPNRDIYRTSSAQNNIWSTQLTMFTLFKAHIHTTVIWKQCRLAPPGGRNTYIYISEYIFWRMFWVWHFTTCVWSQGALKTYFITFILWFQSILDIFLWENQLETSLKYVCDHSEECNTNSLVLFLCFSILLVSNI